MYENMNKGHIYLDAQGYNDILATIDELKERIRVNDLGRSEAYLNGSGTWEEMNAPEYEQIVQTEHMLVGQLDRQYELLANAELIEKHNDVDSIDIGNVLSVDMLFNNDEVEELTFKLVATNGGSNKNMKEVSINSPLGQAVYKKKIGDMCSYSVENNNISVLIKDKINKTEQTEKVKQKFIRK